MARKPPQPLPNLLDLVPARLVDCERTPEDRVVLLRPKFTWKPVARLLQPRLGRPFFKVHLDDIGTFVWDRIDGRTTIGEIAAAAREHFGDAIEPVHERLKTFLYQLESGEFIKLPR